jgi:hypothetical protein
MQNHSCKEWVERVGEHQDSQPKKVLIVPCSGRKREGKICILVSQGKEAESYKKSQAQYKTVQNLLTNGKDSKLKMYPCSPRMLPPNITPELSKEEIRLVEVDEYAGLTTNVKKAPVKRSTSSTLNAHDYEVWCRLHKVEPEDLPSPWSDALGNFNSGGNSKGTRKSLFRHSVCKSLDLMHVENKTSLFGHSAITQSLSQFYSWSFKTSLKKYETETPTPVEPVHSQHAKHLSPVFDTFTEEVNSRDRLSPHSQEGENMNCLEDEDHLVTFDHLKADDGLDFDLAELYKTTLDNSNPDNSFETAMQTDLPRSNIQHNPEPRHPLQDKTNTLPSKSEIKSASHRTPRIVTCMKDVDPFSPPRWNLRPQAYFKNPTPKIELYRKIDAGFLADAVQKKANHKVSIAKDEASDSLREPFEESSIMVTKIPLAQSTPNPKLPKPKSFGLSSPLILESPIQSIMTGSPSISDFQPMRKMPNLSTPPKFNPPASKAYNATPTSARLRLLKRSSGQDDSVILVDGDSPSPVIKRSRRRMVSGAIPKLQAEFIDLEEDASDHETGTNLVQSMSTSPMSSFMTSLRDNAIKPSSSSLCSRINTLQTSPSHHNRSWQVSPNKTSEIATPSSAQVHRARSRSIISLGDGSPSPLIVRRRTKISAYRMPRAQAQFLDLEAQLSGSDVSEDEGEENYGTMDSFIVEDEDMSQAISHSQAIGIYQQSLLPSPINVHNRRKHVFDSIIQRFQNPTNLGSMDDVIEESDEDDYAEDIDTTRASDAFSDNVNDGSHLFM